MKAKDVITQEKIRRLMRAAIDFKNKNKKLNKDTSKLIDVLEMKLVLVYQSGITKEIEDAYYKLSELIHFDKILEEDSKIITDDEKDFDINHDFIQNLANEYLKDFGNDDSDLTNDIKFQLNILNDLNSSEFQKRNAKKILSYRLQTFYGNFEDEINIYKKALATKK